jgi:hypothetical protein
MGWEGADIFVHISAVPREGGRPRTDELISFELETGRDGKQRAVRVMRPASKRAARAPVPPAQVRVSRGSKVGGAISLLAVVAVGIYGVSKFRQYAGDGSVAAPVQRPAPAEPAASCDGRTMCSQMTSCAEATYFIRNCPNTTMDGDDDGVPCESQWCG